MLLYNIITQN